MSLDARRKALLRMMSAMRGRARGRGGDWEVEDIEMSSGGEGREEDSFIIAVTRSRLHEERS